MPLAPHRSAEMPSSAKRSLIAALTALLLSRLMLPRLVSVARAQGSSEPPQIMSCLSCVNAHLDVIPLSSLRSAIVWVYVVSCSCMQQRCAQRACPAEGPPTATTHGTCPLTTMTQDKACHHSHGHERLWLAQRLRHGSGRGLHERHLLVSHVDIRDEQQPGVARKLTQRRIQASVSVTPLVGTMVERGV
jgi:hypothetical protein